ncbi:hypothetical protein [Novosphingobium guangzhouense]|uniref:Uncharacterized protein n=1 Tax=Novosphingobium guangzhouense TaxID=1850347 RepID=A0A2K2G764_9SPHN|nr:hypothetical protein [Novosphingobium guangzhouense]PNU06877.1 hypothetical protein A8V01_01530 [Novosphingobium guangzhouense]
MRGTNSIIARAALAAALVANAGGTAHAQSTGQSGGTWSLPDPTETQSRSRAQGPVDAQNPVVRPGSTAPQAPTAVTTPTPAPAPAPIATRAPNAVPTIAAPPPRPAATRAPAVTPTPTPSPTPSPRASAEPAPEPSAATSAEPTAPAEVATSAPAAPSAAEPETVPAPVPAAQGWPVWSWAVPVLLLVLGALAFLLRRKRPQGEDAEYVEAEAAPVAPPAPRPEARSEAASAVPQPTFTPPPAPSAPPPVPSSPASADTGPQIAFEPLGMRLSLVYATLRYRITVTAAEALPAGQLIGDMTGAHGSIPPEQQLAPPPEALAALKPIPALAAGEGVSLTGEVLLPLNAIRPLQRGNASFFVPLLRLCALFGDDASPVRRVFTLGIEGDTALAPLRLDTGPNEFRDLAAREVTAARAYPVMPDDRRVAAG